jgi:hypothetical protein
MTRTQSDALLAVFMLVFFAYLAVRLLRGGK